MTSAPSLAGEPPAKHPRVESGPRGAHAEGAERDPGFAGLLSAASSAGCYWNPKLVRAPAPPLHVPGVVAREPLQEGEVLCRVPASLHLSAHACSRSAPSIFEACEALPSQDPDRRAEAARVLCVALLLRDQAGADAASGGWQPPELWQRWAQIVKDLDFFDHPYRQLLMADATLAEELAPSAEVAHVRAQAEYVLEVHRCVQEHVAEAVVGQHVGVELFVQAWLCLLSRSFGSPLGSAVVPLVDFFNHHATPTAEQHWEPGEEGTEGAVAEPRGREPIVLVTAAKGHEAGEEELAWTYTFEESRMQAVCLELGCQDMAAKCEELPNIHLDAALVTDTLAAFLAACSELQAVEPMDVAGAAAGGGTLLRHLCSDAKRNYEQDPALQSCIEALRCLRCDPAPASAARGDWWNCRTNVEEIREKAASDAIRVKMSEYLCLAAHLEAMDGAPEERCLAFASNLRQDLSVLHRAGLLPGSAVRAGATPEHGGT